LKLRSCWGLAPDRLVEPARPLRGAVADLEALTGRAVVLSQPSLMDYWCVPEPCGAAVCVPVSSATTLLGTLWMFGDEPRDFSGRETNLVEIVAGRLAGELEREILLSEGMASADLRRQHDAGQRLQQSQLPQTTPLVDPWDLAGWTYQSTGIGGTFHDWFTLPDGRLAVMVVDAQGRGVEAALVGQAVRAAVRAHAAHQPDPGRVLACANQDLWSGSAGDQYAAVLLAVTGPDTGTLSVAVAGDIGALVLTGGSWETLTAPEIPLGVQPDRGYEARSVTLDARAAMIVTTGAIRQQVDSCGQCLEQGVLADALRPHCGGPATGLIAALRHLTGADPTVAGGDGWTALAVSRKG